MSSCLPALQKEEFRLLTALNTLPDVCSEFVVEVDWENDLRVLQQKGMCWKKWGQDAIIQKGFLMHGYVLAYSLVWRQKEPLT